jgi:dihydrofolate synthase/folylpolyglutamate synthase
MNYQEANDFIFGYTNYEMIPRVPHDQANYDLRRVHLILERLGNPHLKARSLHITGTNGKGSTSAMLASVLTKAGFKTGLYTSPHLLTMRERIMVDGQMISEEDVAAIMTRIRPAIETVNREAAYGVLTVFELLTVLGFAYFAEKGCQFQVLEVGMGGRFDATNVIQPEVALLTAISYDHMEVLGDTLTKIAGEKCGIIKPGCVCVSHPQMEEAAKVIEQDCRNKGVKLIWVGRDLTRSEISHTFDHQSLLVKGRLDNYIVQLPLLGQYQLDNTAAAVAALEVLIERKFNIVKQNILDGLAAVDFPGRMQIIGREPFIVVDGGHNPGAAHNLQQALKHYFTPGKTILVIGVSNDKDLAGVVKELAPISSLVIASRANNPRSTKPEMIVAEFAKYGVPAQTAPGIPEAIAQARSLAGKPDLICITGSLFVVGEALGFIHGKQTNG